MRVHFILLLFCLEIVAIFIWAALGAVLGTVLGRDPSLRTCWRHLNIGVVAVLNLSSIEALLQVVVGVDEGVQVLDVVDRLSQDAHLAQLAHGGCPGDLQSQALEALVDVLHPRPLPRVPLYRLQVLLGLDLVPMDRVEYCQLFSTHRCFRPSGFLVCGQLILRISAPAYIETNQLAVNPPGLYRSLIVATDYIIDHQSKFISFNSSEPY